MNSKQRVIEALNFREADKIPWGEHSIDYNVYEMFLGRKSYVHAKFEETKAVWNGRRDEIVESYVRDIPELARVLDMDLITVHRNLPKGYTEKAYKQINEDTYENENGNIFRLSSITGDLMEIPMNTAFIRRDVTLNEVTDMIDSWTKHYSDDNTADMSTYEVIDRVVKDIGDTHFVIGAVNGIEWARFGEDEETSWMNLLTNKEVCSEIAKYMLLDTKQNMRIMKKLGCDGILSVGDLGNTTNLFASPDIYKDIIYPYHQEIYKYAKELGLYVLRHCCGHVWPIIDELAKTNDAYEGIQARAGMDIKKLKETVGDRLCLWGGILHENIHGGTTSDIENDVFYSFKNAAPGGGFIMGSSHSLAVGASKENILKMKELREKYGYYPILNKE